MRDFSSHTEADAGAWERAYGDAGDYDDGAPTRAEAEADEQEAAAWQWHNGPDVLDSGIKCAHCKQYHATIEDVRWCSDLHAEAKAEAEAEQAAEVAFARDREAMAERGTWFGPQTEADGWGE